MSVPLIGAQVALSAEEPFTRFVEVRKVAGLDALILGIRGGEESLAAAAGLCAQCLDAGIEPILWYPVLADAPGVESSPEHLVLTVDGGRSRGSAGRWAALDSVAERFELLCPNQEEAIRPVEERLEALLDRLPVSGVMLDRIRFPSPANGFEALLTCFCPACAERFARRFGYPLERLRKKALGVLGEIHSRPGAGAQWARRWTGEGSLWQYPFLRDLGEFRAESIARLVGRFAERARRRGLSVGLDLFSPAIASLVGQDYLRLAEVIAPASVAPAAPGADAGAAASPEARLPAGAIGSRWPRVWIKPMLYSRAVGPAALPVELSCLAQGLGALAPDVPVVQLFRLIERAVGPLAAEWTALKGPGRLDPEAIAHALSAGFIAHELDSIQSLKLPSEVAVLAGIEAVTDPAYEIETSPEQMRAACAQARGRAAGIVASWDLRRIPSANLEVLGNFKRQ